MRKVVSRDGTTIAVEKMGDGPAIILVDGALCSRAFGPMPGLAPLLAKHFAVYMYDRRGRNESGDTKPYAVEREIEDIEALVDEAGGSAFVYGISSGGALALEAASKLGSKVKKLALYEVPFNSDETARQAARDYAKKLTELLSADRRGDAVALFMKRVGTPADQIAGMSHAPIWSVLETVAPTLAYDNAIMGDGTVPIDRAALVTAPTLVMDGGESYESMRDVAETIAKAIPNGQRRTLEGQTHEVAPEVLAPVLEQFFAGRNESPNKLAESMRESKQ